jgi:hypothetical protein
MPSNQRTNNGPGLALPQDVAQQRAAQQQRAQAAHSMLINISTGVLCQLAHADELRADWSRQRTNESTESHGERLQIRCDETAVLAAKYGEALLNVLGITHRPEAVDNQTG